MTHGRFVAGTLALAMAVSALAQDNYGGVSVGFFLPSDSTLRDRLGASWFSFGASRIKVDGYKKRNIGFDWNGFSKERDGNKVFMLAGSIGLVQPIGMAGNMTRPYFAVRGGLSYIDYAVDVTGVRRESAKRIGFNANAEVGINVGERFTVSARYDVMPSYDGLNFSGFSVQLQYGLVRF
ncbi:MAG: hypothetical protein KIT11_07265 [Fimbriimonadaceae bacterium]|nr:hypothetical protein [Fimbriimonadaceae bacterium]QYK56151.1 MAG: hypothetical protein KF733_01455 [Fimbriimonadaceae bacterium]